LVVVVAKKDIEVKREKHGEKAKDAKLLQDGKLKEDEQMILRF